MVYEDNEVLRQTVVLMMQGTPGIEVVGAFNNCSSVREQLLELNPDVVLMDIDMPGHNGIYGTGLIKQQSPHTNVLMYTVFDDDEKLFAALEAGADGYLLKNTAPLSHQRRDPRQCTLIARRGAKSAECFSPAPAQKRTRPRAHRKGKGNIELPRKRAYLQEHCRRLQHQHGHGKIAPQKYLYQAAGEFREGSGGEGDEV